MENENKDDEGPTELEELQAQITKLEEEKKALLESLQAMKTAMVGFVLEANKNAKDYNVAEKLAELQAMEPKDLVKQMPKPQIIRENVTRAGQQNVELQAAWDKLPLMKKFELQALSGRG